MINCKFKVDSIHLFSTTTGYSLSPVYGSEANRAYWEATPSGSLTLNISNTKGLLLELGKEYFIDIRPDTTDKQ